MFILEKREDGGSDCWMHKLIGNCFSTVHQVSSVSVPPLCLYHMLYSYLLSRSGHMMIVCDALSDGITVNMHARVPVSLSCEDDTHSDTKVIHIGYHLHIVTL